MASEKVLNRANKEKAEGNKKIIDSLFDNDIDRSQETFNKGRELEKSSKKNFTRANKFRAKTK